MARIKIFDVDGTNNEIIMGDASTLLTCIPLTTSSLVATDGSKRLTSDTTSLSPIFAGLTLTGNITMPNTGWIGRSTSHRIQFNNTNTEIRFDSPYMVCYRDGYDNTIELANHHTGGGPSFILNRARGTGASKIIVNDNDVIGSIKAKAWSGTLFRQSGTIRFEVDGAPAAGSVPGNIILSTTVTGNASATDRLRIDSVGNTYIGDAGATNYTQIALDGSFSQVGTARIDWTKIVANGVTLGDGPPTSGDTVSDLQTAHDGNTYTVSEIAANAGQNLIVDFTGVTAFNWVQILARVEEQAGHCLTVQLEITPFDDSAWHTYHVMKDQNANQNFENYSFFVPDDSAYINSGVVKVRFIHEMDGNANDSWVYNVVALYQ